MKTYTFPTQGSFGKGDSWDGEFTFTLSDDEAKRLQESARKESRYWCSLSDDPDIADIEAKVLKASREKDIRNMLKDKELVQEQREWYEDDVGEEASDKEVIEWYLDQTSYEIMYPEELQQLEGK
jgi:hypothetical protein